jgi:hypothetical protein
MRYINWYRYERHNVSMYDTVLYGYYYAGARDKISFRLYSA